jgi:hypothetical protein
MPHIRTFSDTILVRLYAQVEIAVREGRAVQIHVCCEHKPGILVSTMRAMDNLGLDIQQGVISCSNGFVMDIYRAEVEPLSFYHKSLGFFSENGLKNCCFLSTDDDNGQLTLFSAMHRRAGRPTGANQSRAFGLSWRP